MPELRKDPITGRWIIISVERAARPTSFISQEKPKLKGGFCPLCPGNEDKTPPEIIAIRPDGSAPNTSGWVLRVVPNKFPALRIEGDLGKEGLGIYDRMNGIGAHEVVIESSNHEATLASLSLEEFQNVLWAYRQRIIDLKNDTRLKYVLVFKNHGEAAGASLEHSHSQIIALPVLPKAVVEEIEGAKEYYRFRDRCVFCDVIRQEMKEGTRIIAENESYLAIAPFASRSPFETWILPKRHISSYQLEEDERYTVLSELFSTVLRKLNKALNNPPYNFVLHTAPLGEDYIEHYHWHFEIMPRLTKIAGFEWGSGFYINPVPPEDAAKFLRETDA